MPSMIFQLVNTPEWEKADTSSVETIGCGAASLPPDLRARFQSKMNAVFLQGYGSSEAVRVPSPFPTIPEKYTSQWALTDFLNYRNDAGE